MNKPTKKKLYELSPGTEFTYQRKKYRTVVPPARSIPYPKQKGQVLRLSSNTIDLIGWHEKVSVNL